jgi:hypothetical protein
MKFQDVARFEFRVFGQDLTALREALGALGLGTRHRPSRETYIVTRLNVESNVKIRAGRLEVKGLKGRLRLLEQWQPILKSEFPVAADDIENIVAPALGIDVDLKGKPPLSEAALMALVAEQPALAVIIVEKKRTLYDFEDCEAEFTELSLGGERIETAAVEAVEPQAAETLVQRTGLNALENESYSLFLQRRLFSHARST